MTPKILIAGATGTNGSALLKELAADAIPVRALVRDTARAANLKGPLVELVQGDLRSPATLDAALADIDTAYIVVAIEPDTVELFDNFYAAAKRAGVRRVVKFSGLGADVASPSTVIRQHGISDERLIGSGLAYTILRPNSFHQNMLWMAGSIAATGKFYMPLGDARQSLIDVRDIAAITAKVLTKTGHDGKIYELTGAESLSFDDVARAISGATGKPVDYVPVSVEAAEQAMRANGMPEWHARALAEIQALFATGAFAAPMDTAGRLLERAPRSFQDFAQDHAAQFTG
jgi:uncharacterized protein YbjT (DUF2867 family)